MNTLQNACVVVCLIAGTLVTGCAALWASGWMVTMAIEAWGTVFAVSKIVFRRTFWAEARRQNVKVPTATDIVDMDSEAQKQ